MLFRVVVVLSRSSGCGLNASWCDPQSHCVSSGRLQVLFPSWDFKTLEIATQWEGGEVHLIAGLGNSKGGALHCLSAPVTSRWGFFISCILHWP